MSIYVNERRETCDTTIDFSNRYSKKPNFLLGMKSYYSLTMFVILSTYLLISLLVQSDVVVGSSSTTTMTTTSTLMIKNSFQPTILHAPPISLRSGWNKFITLRWLYATTLAKLEQSVEDYNSEYISSSSSTAEACRHRRLIILPLDDRMDPPIGVFSHNHLQTGDKVCLPANFWQAIQLNHAEVPWLFSIKRIPGITSERVELIKKLSKPTKMTTQRGQQQQRNEDDKAKDDADEEDEDPIIISPYKSLEELDQVIAGPLDFRAPSCYIFVPLWMMRALNVRPRDVVEVELIETIPPGSLAKLRPHSSEFAKDISNPQAVLETELRHYSSLTKGSTIAFDYNKKRYWFDVVELRSAPRGEKQKVAIKVQDCDIATDFLPAKDTLKKRSKRKRRIVKDNESS
jgi:Ubiquitin fusion degradation protein UFD1